MSLRTVDLNLVPVLQTLLRERSVSRAAQLLGLSQPAVSAALRRLRRSLGDELLVRTGGPMELTQRATELVAQLDDVCQGLEALFVLPSFNPATAARTFTIAASDQATFLLAPDWLDALAHVAPCVRLRFVDLNDMVYNRMAARELDFALMPLFFAEDMKYERLRFRALFPDSSVAMFRRGHALAARDVVSEQALAPWRVVSFQPAAGWVDNKHGAALLGNHTLDPIAFVPQLSLLPFLLIDRDTYAIIPRRMAERLATLLPLDWRPLDFATPPVDMGIAWNHVWDADPGHRWFRERIVTAPAAPLHDTVADRSPAPRPGARGAKRRG